AERSRAACESRSSGTVGRASGSRRRSRSWWRADAADGDGRCRGAGALSRPRRLRVSRQRAEPADVLARAAGDQRARLRGGLRRVLPVLLHEGGLRRTPGRRRHSAARLSGPRRPPVQPDRDRAVGARELQPPSADGRARAGGALPSRGRLAPSESQAERPRRPRLAARVRLGVSRHVEGRLVLGAGARAGRVAPLPRAPRDRTGRLPRSGARGVPRAHGERRRRRRPVARRSGRGVARGDDRRSADPHPERVPVGDVGRPRLRGHLGGADRRGAPRGVRADAPAARRFLRLRVLVALRAVGDAAPDAREPLLSFAPHLAALDHGSAPRPSGAGGVVAAVARVRRRSAVPAAGARPEGALQAALLLTMHVLLIHQAFAGPNDPGGTRHYELGRSLVANGHRVTIVASATNYLTGLSGDGGDGDLPAGMRIIRVGGGSELHRSYWARAKAFVAFARAALAAALRIEDVDVVWGTSPPLVQVLPAWLASLRCRGGLVFEERDLWPEFAIGMGVIRDGALARAAVAFKRFMYARARTVVINSPGFLPFVQRHGVPREKIHVIPNGVDVTQFHPEERGDDLRRE